MEYYEKTAAQSAQELRTDTKHGLSSQESDKRLIKYGKNRLKDQKKKSFFMRFFEQFNDFMIIILLSAAAVSFLTSFLSGSNDITEPVIILAIVTMNALLGTIEQIRAENSLKALNKLSSPHSVVIRDGTEYKINSEDIVPGDIIRVRAGDMICADCRIIECDNLRVDESALTGESVAVSKDSTIIHPPLTATADIKNMLFASTYVTSGNATAIVTKTGMNTEVGKIASLLLTTENNGTPLQKRLADTGKTLGICALMICGIIFIIGMFKKIPPFEMFMTSVSLAVAAIPEGLPAIVTIMLALGVMRMSRHNAIVRNLPSVETLGCAGVICTDKTGTLTQNKMKVSKIYTKNEHFLLELCCLCSDDGEFINPTDTALITAARDYGIDIDLYRRTYPRGEYIPFDSTRKRMSVKCVDKTIVKGAPELILPLCNRYFDGEKDIPLTDSLRKSILRENEQMTKNALRVIGCGYKTDRPSAQLSESELIFVGLIGISDPPRPEAVDAVKTCTEAGIRTVMITGDHAKTALAIAKKTGICTDTDTAITGIELDKMTDEELREAVKKCSVYARVSPSHKTRIVTAMQENGNIVAMTGDGINDAPALKKADIGCSMGITGTDVAKSASDIILTDDNFATIVYAVKEGRCIYDNIKKSVKFLLSSNIGEILTVLFGIVFGCRSPLNAIELLWVNLVTDSFPAIALGLDNADKDIMKRKPLDPKKGIFSGGLWASIVFEGLMIGSLSLLAYEIGHMLFHTEIIARTMAFFVLSVSQLTHAFNMRSEKSIMNKDLFENKYLVFSFIAGLLIQLILIYTPFTAEIFGLCALSSTALVICIVLSVMPVVIVEAQKALNTRLDGVQSK